MGKKRVQKVKCPNRQCDGYKREICVEEQIELGNFYTVANISYVECSYCCTEIIVSMK